MTRTLTASTFALAAATAMPAFAQDLPQTGNEWFIAAQDTVAAALERQQNTDRALNIILMVSDGNGVGSNYATRLFAGQQAGNFGDEHVLPFETFPNLALVKTYNVNSQTPDSAGTGTAMMSGVKTNIGVVGVTSEVVRGDCSTLEGNTVASFNEIADGMGKATGIVSTARITHATPASAYAKSVDRNFEDAVPEGCESQSDIAQQLLAAMEAGVIDVAMGGGMRHFLPESEEGGRRADGQNLVEVAQNELGAQFASDMVTFGEIDPEADAPILGLFEMSHMMYEADRNDEPSLAEMTEAAITALQAKGGENGFFLQVEAGRVDHANHAGNAARMVRDGMAFAEAVALADEMTDDADTLIVVTADHEHSLAFNGYCGRGSDILGLCMTASDDQVEHSGEPELGADEKPYTVIGYLNGPGSILVPNDEGEFTGTRADVTNEEATDIDYLQQALIPKSSESHSGEDVAVYAKGPFAHLYDGTIEQNVIFHVMHHAMTAE
ncbi:alkaline phosphatase [Roseivivax sediminis]|uniref:Alkaline phosphatase n=1 Tax=Roseivivax sediminis TaxID=936889 RepID=A0A1I2CPY4_9RHOB|nr:alkaline phosphatase [Roseivivax sediminis]SFE70284.1 alkaline phosphatase [Roseivivax sediminis]